MQKLFPLVLAALIAVVAADHDALAQKRPSPSGVLSAQQQSTAKRLLAQFRVARKDPEKRAEIVRQAEAAGSAAVSSLLAIIEREMAPHIRRYNSKFYQTAVRVVQKRIRKIDLQEVTQLRATVLGLRSSPDFTHESIVAKADPAMKRLQEIFVIDCRDVLDQSKELRQQRERLFVLGRLWQQCAVNLYREIPEGPDRPKAPPSFEAYLQGEEELAAGLAAPMDQATRGILAANARLASQLDPEEVRAILALNLTRNLLGLSALMIDLKLCATARDHSKDMQEKQFFAHESPVPGKKTPWDRSKRFGVKASAENIYRGAHDGRAADRGWFHSPGHHKNMLGNHKRVGVGRRAGYFTQMFGR